MTVAIMQPYFFPYIGYFQLIQAADRFILFNDVQYIRHGWINRNRILKPGGGIQYIVMPLAAHARETLIKDIAVADADNNRQKVLRQIEHYKKPAPFYKDVRALLGDCFTTSESNITQMNAGYLKAVCDYIGISYKIEISSQMNFDYTQVHDAGEWALRMCEQLQATTYINPPGGKGLFDNAKFEQSNIRLQFLQPALKEYDQRRETFEPGLSIIDVMMFNGPAAIKDLLTDYQLV
ncbi:MAG TPA: WbqC family protein [Niastella sp.]